MEVVVLLSDKVPEVCHLIKQRLLITEKQDTAWNCQVQVQISKRQIFMQMAWRKWVINFKETLCAVMKKKNFLE